MKKHLLKLSFTLIFASATLVTQAQNFGDILATGADNANTYLQNYAAPGINAFGNGMADGWYNTAKPHSTLGFNFTFSPSFSFIPQSDMSFAFNAADYKDLTLEGDADGILPTFVGGDAEAGSKLVFSGGSPYPGVDLVANTDAEFAVPSGVINLDKVPVMAAIPSPTYNVGIGIYKSTELKLRLLPEISVGDFRAKMFGFGVQHDIKQWIPVVNKLPFDLSVLVATSTLDLEYDLDVNVASNEGQINETRFSGSGTAAFKTTSTTVQVLVSKKLLIFTPYAAVGFNAVKSSLDMKGDYEYKVGPKTTSISDPISLDFDNAGGMRATIGARLQLAVITFHAAYTAQKYNTFNMGMGVTFR